MQQRKKHKYKLVLAMKIDEMGKYRAGGDIQSVDRIDSTVDNRNYSRNDNIEIEFKTDSKIDSRIGTKIGSKISTSSPKLETTTSTKSTQTTESRSELLRRFSIYHQGRSSVFSKTGTTPIDKFISPCVTPSLNNFNYHRTTGSVTSLSLCNTPLETPVTLLTDNTSLSRFKVGHKGQTTTKNSDLVVKRHTRSFSSRTRWTRTLHYNDPNTYGSCEEVYDAYLDFYIGEEAYVT